MILSKQIHFVGDSIAAKREMLRQCAAELRRKQEETVRELATITARSDELVRDIRSADAVVVDMDLDYDRQENDVPLSLITAQPANEVRILYINTTRF